MLETLKILRQAGFYKDLNNLTESEILQVLHQRQKDSFLEHFNWDHEPNKNVSFPKNSTF